VTTKTSTLAQAIEAAVAGRKVMMQCPVHDDSTASLSIGPGTTHPVVMRCMANCQTEDILASEGLSWADISAEMEERQRENLWTPRGQASHVYPYHDAQGTLLYEVLRVPEAGGKTFTQRRPDPDTKSGYAWNLNGVDRTIYRLPQVLEAIRDGGTIHLCEGEKDVHSVLSVITAPDEATCNSGGAGRWLDEFSEILAEANVIVYADADEAGRDHARAVRESLLKHDCTVTIREAPAGRTKQGKPIKDVTDHLDAGRTLETMLETTPGSEAAKVRTATDWFDIVQRPDHQEDWVIKDSIARGEVLLLVGPEGGGKAELLRQIAVCTSAGIHPFTCTRIPAQRVLYVDGENRPHQTLGSWKRLMRAARGQGDPQPGMLHVMEERGSEIDLTSLRGKQWLTERAHAYAPDLIIIGPLSNMAPNDLVKFEEVHAFRRTIEHVMEVSGCAFAIEHHAPLRQAGDKKREMRPYGNGLLMKWPDFGYGMVPVEDHPDAVEFRGFRGARVRGRSWPSALRWGSAAAMEMPWVECIVDKSGNVIG
jgi:5S rRNA maturation endonuclease (ribonuclease M5)